jgi:hypothetical protein
MARNQKKRTKKPKRAPTEHYTPESYSHAIARACGPSGFILGNPKLPNKPGVGDQLKCLVIPNNRI